MEENSARSLVKTPWDARALGIDTYELKEVNEEALAELKQLPGHFAVRINPLDSKKLLHDHGFYYCDTLIEPFCTRNSFSGKFDRRISCSRKPDLTAVLSMARGAFSFDRFHRDFSIPVEQADSRYEYWLKDLHAAGDCLGLSFNGELAGFFCFSGSKAVLHALSASWRGQGKSKYFWSAACEELFSMGHVEISSSISAANMPAVNLYASLGFRFRNPCDIYHKLNRPAAL